MMGKSDEVLDIARLLVAFQATHDEGVHCGMIAEMLIEQGQLGQIPCILRIDLQSTFIACNRMMFLIDACVRDASASQKWRLERILP